LKRYSIATAVFDFNDSSRVEALATLVLDFNNHAIDQAHAPGVIHPGRRDLAPMFFHPCELISG
jgi:hypothetical protein